LAEELVQHAKIGDELNLFVLFGMAKPCAAHSKLFVLQSTPISHSHLTSFFNWGRTKHGT
jgi:hypothetical protein